MEDCARRELSVKWLALGADVRRQSFRADLLDETCTRFVSPVTWDRDPPTVPDAKAPDRVPEMHGDALPCVDTVEVATMWQVCP